MVFKTAKHSCSYLNVKIVDSVMTADFSCPVQTVGYHAKIAAAVEVERQNSMHVKEAG